jgi:hypothetical protein
MLICLALVIGLFFVLRRWPANIPAPARVESKDKPSRAAVYDPIEYLSEETSDAGK